MLAKNEQASGSRATDNVKKIVHTPCELIIISPDYQGNGSPQVVAQEGNVVNDNSLKRRLEFTNLLVSIIPDPVTISHPEKTSQESPTIVAGEDAGARKRRRTSESDDSNSKSADGKDEIGTVKFTQSTPDAIPSALKNSVTSAGTDFSTTSTRVGTECDPFIVDSEHSGMFSSAISPKTPRTALDEHVLYFSSVYAPLTNGDDSPSKAPDIPTPRSSPTRHLHHHQQSTSQNSHLLPVNYNRSPHVLPQIKTAEPPSKKPRSKRSNQLPYMFPTEDGANISNIIQQAADALLELFAKDLQAAQTRHDRQMSKLASIYEATGHHLGEQLLTERNKWAAEWKKREVELEKKFREQHETAMAEKELKTVELLSRVKKESYAAYQKQLNTSEENFQKEFQSKLDKLGVVYAEELQNKFKELQDAKRNAKDNFENNIQLRDKLLAAEVKLNEVVQYKEEEIAQAREISVERLNEKNLQLSEAQAKMAKMEEMIQSLKQSWKETEGKLREAIQQRENRIQELNQTSEKILHDNEKTVLELQANWDKDRQQLNALLEEGRKTIAEKQYQAQPLQGPLKVSRTEENPRQTAIVKHFADNQESTEPHNSDVGQQIKVSDNVELRELKESLSKEKRTLQEEQVRFLEQVERFQEEKCLIEEDKRHSVQLLEEERRVRAAQVLASNEERQKEKQEWLEKLKETIMIERKQAETEGYERGIRKLQETKVAVHKERLLLQEKNEGLELQKKKLEAQIVDIEAKYSNLQEIDNTRMVTLTEHWAREMEKRWSTFLEADQKKKEEERLERETERKKLDEEVQGYKQRLDESERKLNETKLRLSEVEAQAQQRISRAEEMLERQRLITHGSYSRAEAKDILEKVVTGPNFSQPIPGLDADEKNGSNDENCHIQ